MKRTRMKRIKGAREAGHGVCGHGPLCTRPKCRRYPRMKRVPMRRVSAKRQTEMVKLAELRLYVLERDQYRCRYCQARGVPLDIQHVIKRSQRPDLLLDAQNCIALCRKCHDWADNKAPQGKEGKLKIEPLGKGGVYFWIDYEGKLARLAGALSVATNH